MPLDRKINIKWLPGYVLTHYWKVLALEIKYHPDTKPSGVSRAPSPLRSAGVKRAKKNGSCSAVDFFYRHLLGIDRL